MSVDSKKIYTTPKGISVFPKLTAPDTKFNKDGVYSVRMKFTKEDEDKLVALLTGLSDEAYAAHCIEKKSKKLKRADLPWKPEVEKVFDDEGNVIEENETGFLLFNFKLKAKITSRAGKVINLKPTIYDAAGKSVNTEGLDIGGGSELRVAFTVRPFLVDTLGSGLSLQLQGVQIINLVQFGEKSASSMGFGTEEGYSSSEADGSSMPAGITGASDAGDF